MIVQSFFSIFTSLNLFICTILNNLFRYILLSSNSLNFLKSQVFFSAPNLGWTVLRTNRPFLEIEPFLGLGHGVLSANGIGWIEQATVDESYC